MLSTTVLHKLIQQNLAQFAHRLSSLVAVSISIYVNKIQKILIYFTVLLTKTSKASAMKAKGGVLAD